MKRLIPFSWLPGAWGLKGTARKRAQAEYELEGYELEVELANIDFPDEQERNRQLLEIDRKYDKITKEEYMYKMLEFIKDPVERAVEELDLDLRFGKISDTEHEKKVATAKQEPWVTVIDLNVRDETGNWNDYFIQDLKEAGFQGMSDEDIVNSWFSRICRDIALSEYSGQGDFDERLAEAENRMSKQSETDDDGRRVIK